MTKPTDPPRVHPPVDLVVLAGGRGSRLGGRDKAALVVAGTSLLDRILGGIGPQGVEPLGGKVVVVGPTPVPEGILSTQEEPPDGGPVAGIAAGLEALEAVAEAEREMPAWVAVVAVDQPSAAKAVTTLRDQLAVIPEGMDLDAVSHVDASNHLQWLLAIYRRDRLQQALAALPTVRDTSVRNLVEGLSWLAVMTGGEHLGDVDTWEDVQAWEERLGRRGQGLRD